MRLHKDEIALLKTTLGSLSSEAKLFLFGSRTDDTKRGGDIDLLVISKRLTPKDMRRLRIEFWKKFGEQKIDIVLDDGTLKKPFHQIAYSKAIEL